MVVIANPAAGGGRARARLERLLPALTAALACSPRLLWSAAPGHAERLAHAARGDGAALVIAAGGDGTVHEVVNGLLAGEPALHEWSAAAEGSPVGGVRGRQRPPATLAEGGAPELPELAVLPLGTGCDFARGLGLARRPEGAVAELARACVRPLDVGVGWLPPRQGGAPRTRVFANAVNAGLGGSVVAATRRRPLRAGRAAYALAAISAVRRARAETLTLLVDGRERRVEALHVSVCNGPCFGGGLYLCPDARPDDGRLSYATVAPLSPWAAALRLPALYRGRFEHPAVRRGEGRCVALSGPEWLVEAEGEILGRLPARLSLWPGALRVRVPAEPGV